MFVSEISLENFRNIKKAEIAPSESVNVIYGENAQGKTNLLEGIWMFSGFRSFRTIKDSELVNFDSLFASLKMKFEDEQRDHEAELKITDRRRIKLNGIGLRSASEMIGRFNCVIFSPGFMSVVKDGPEKRRNFTDTAICQLTPSYTGILSDYNRVLRQRNSMLKIPESIDATLLDCLDEQLAVTGEKLIKYRKRYIEIMSPYICDIYSGLSGGREAISLGYVARHNENDDKQLIDMLKESRNKDFITGTTTVGPHRDDIEIKINDIPARMFGSQGQQRSCAIALKLSEAAVLYEKSGIKPVVLLDDVMSELDIGRQDYILNHIGDRQVFITCCEPETITRMASGKCICVESGKVTGSV